jgi:beta-glucosidase
LGADTALQETGASLSGQGSTTSQAEVAERVNDLLGRMSLEEKIGQMVLFTSSGPITGPSGERQDLREQIQKGNCGAIFNAHTVARVRQFQRLAVEGSRLKVPLLFGYDVIHGYKTVFPIPLGEAASWDLKAIERSARVAAIEATAAGLNWTFAPMVDIARDPRWGRIAEGAGEDPFLGCAIARARVQGFQGKRLGSDASSILACVKHYAAYGAPQAGRDYNSVDISERTLEEVYLPPYRAAVDAGVGSVMSSFNEVNGVPGTANSYLLTDVLRKRWGFKGFIVTDYTAINELVKHGIATDECDAGREAVEAGIDMDMQGAVYLDCLKRMVTAGQISPGLIDEAARRVLEVKFRLGLFEDPYRYCDEAREARLTLAPDHLEATHKIACESMVLLKNEAGILPLKPGLKIAVVGPLASAQRDLLGSWCGQGDGRLVLPVVDAIRKLNADGKVLYAKGCEVSGTNRSEFKEAIKVVKRSDVAVVVLGETADMSGEASSRTSINLPGVQTELLRELKKSGRPLIIVLLNGRPLALEEEVSMADAVVEAWQPGTKGGEAIGDVLFGNCNTSGKLPVTFPRNLGQVPIWYSVKNTGRPYNPAQPHDKFKSVYIDSPNDPLFPFGFGLSYTSFAYSKIKSDANIIAADGKLHVTMDVTNTGKRAGTEIVQMYIRGHSRSVTRPLLELKGFQRVDLQPGASQRVEFAIGAQELTFLRRDMTWGLEPGGFEVLIGPNSRELQSIPCRLTGSSTPGSAPGTEIDSK